MPHAREPSLSRTAPREPTVDTAAKPHDPPSSLASESSQQRHLHLHQHGRHELHNRLHRHSHYLPSSRNRPGHRGGEVDGDARGSNVYNGNNNAELRRRQTTGSAPLITEIVETISVVQVIDGDGSIIEVKTMYSPPVTQTIDTLDTITAELSDLTHIPTTIGTSSSDTTILGGTDATRTTGTSSSSTTWSTSASATELTTGTSVTSSSSLKALTGSTSITEPFTNGTTSAGSSTLTTVTVPLTTGLNTPLPVVLNSSSTPIFSNNSSSQRTLFTNTSRVKTTSSQIFSSSLLTNTFVTSTTSALNAVEATNAGGAGGTATAPVETDSGGAPSSSGSADNTDTSKTPAGVVVGSVIGGLAGVTLLLVVAMFIIKWKRRGMGGHALLADGDEAAAAVGGSRDVALLGDGSGSSAAGTSGGNGGGGGPGGGMSENHTAFLMPFLGAIAAGQKRLSRGTASNAAAVSDARYSSMAGDGNAERGFYRVSGKKLPSVLQHGGDGYEDPRESMLSDNRSMYRDSQGFFGGAGGPATTPTSRYAVGSPMRPESGVPVFHSGPGKVASTLVSPSRPGSSFHDAASVRNLTPPPHIDIDPIGRSMASQDNSRGSASRFMEEMS